MYRRLGKNTCDAHQEYKRSNLRGDIPYATVNAILCARSQEPVVKILRLLPHKARHQTPKPLYLVFHPLADPEAPETRKNKN
jgi:hypothetical protein